MSFYCITRAFPKFLPVGLCLTDAHSTCSSKRRVLKLVRKLFLFTLFTFGLAACTTTLEPEVENNEIRRPLHPVGSSSFQNSDRDRTSSRKGRVLSSSCSTKSFRSSTSAGKSMVLHHVFSTYSIYVSACNLSAKFCIASL